MGEEEKFSPELEAALKDTPLYMRKDIPKGGMNVFIDNLVRNFIRGKIDEFPRMCAETRKANFAKKKFLKDHGYKTPTRMIGGTVYEGTDGWSKDKNFCFQWEVSNELFFFMRNCVYKDFWEDKNAKVNRSFMKALMRGDDPFELLRKVRAYYGNNPEEEG